MTLCDLTQSYSAVGGGIRTYLHAKRDYLARETDHEHVLIVPGEADTVTRDGRLTTYTVASPRVPTSPNYRLLLRSGRVLEILAAERPDLVETLDAYNLPWTALLHRRRHPACAVVAGYLTDVPTAYVEPAVRRVAGRRVARVVGALTYRYLGALYGRMDGVYALSSDATAHLRALGAAHVETLPLGVDPAVFRPDRRDERVRQRLGVGPGEPLLVYVGRLDAEKRPDLVVDAFERLPAGLGAHLAVVGEGPLHEALAVRAAQNGRLHIAGFLSDREALADLLASADLYVSAMPHETFGVSVIEAQASGLPVVGVRAGAMTDRVPPDVGRLGPAGDAAAMARNIQEILEGDLPAMARSARALVETVYAWNAVFGRFLSFYDHALARRPGRPRGLDVTPRPPRPALVPPLS